MYVGAALPPLTNGDRRCYVYQQRVSHFLRGGRYGDEQTVEQTSPIPNSQAPGLQRKRHLEPLKRRYTDVATALW